MTRFHRRALVGAAVSTALASVLATGCGSHNQGLAADRPTATTTPGPTAAPTTAKASTTTSTVPPKPAGLAPLTDLPQLSAAQLRSPAVVVKIDNVVGALPQTGINQADVVYEELVEGGLTRLAAVFQSVDPNVVGPVRSARLTDIDLIDDLHHPVFAFAGTNDLFLPRIRSQPIDDVDIGDQPGLFHRAGPNAAPHNLFTDVATDAATDDPATAPPALFRFHPPGRSMTGAGTVGATRLAVAWPATTASWTFDRAGNDWTRVQDGSVDRDSTGRPVSASNVIVQAIPYVTSAIADEPSSGLTAIPEGELIGRGPVWVFSGDRMIEGTWTRTASDGITSFTDRAGHAIAVAPGRTWVELIEADSAPRFSTGP